MLFRAGFTGSQISSSRDLVGRPAGNLGRAGERGPQRPDRRASSATPPGAPTSAATTAPSLTARRLRALGATRRDLARLRGRRGRDRTSTPWELGARGDGRAPQASAILHYELFPYHYELARRASCTGLSDAAAAWPSSTRATSSAWARRVRAPRRPRPSRGAGTGPSGRDRRRVPPAGRWVDLGTGTEHDRADVTFDAPDPLDELPLYLRERAAIPYNLRTPTSGASPWRLERPLPTRARRLARGTRYEREQRRARRPTTARFRGHGGRVAASESQLTRARRETAGASCSGGGCRSEVDDRRAR